MSLDPSEIILIYRFDAQEIFRIVINAENRILIYIFLLFIFLKFKTTAFFLLK